MISKNGGARSGTITDRGMRNLLEWLRFAHMENRWRAMRRIIRQGIYHTCSPWFFDRSLQSCHRYAISWPASYRGCFVLSFDLDWREDTERLPELIEMMKERRLVCSIAAIGKWVELFPDAYRQAIDTGHEIFNHTYSHPDSVELGRPEKFNEIGLESRIEEIRRGDETLRRVLGIEPRGFRAPHFSALNTTDILPFLASLGYSYSASTIAFKTPRYGLPYRPIPQLWEFPVSGSPREFYRLLGTYDIRRAPQPLWRDDEDFLQEWSALLDAVMRNEAFGSAFLDPMDLFYGDGILGRGILDKLRAAQDHGLWVTTYADLANWLEEHPPHAGGLKARGQGA
jgi:peptidoglycan/xylan/chitin deacetylase (PgdA/CDA1 family)